MRLSEFTNNNKEVFNSVETLSIDEIASKHNVSIDVIQKELQRGITVEKEHTTHTRIAQEIVLDHLTEDPYYYRKLAKAGL